MSNLLKALKRAERDREAAKQAHTQPKAAAASPPSASLEPPVAADPSPGQGNAEKDNAPPAVMRSQRDAVRTSERLAPHSAPRQGPVKTYRSVGITLMLATLFAVGVGLTLRNRDAEKPPAPRVVATETAEAAKAAAPVAASIPATLLNAGHLQLRLDRSVEAVGEMAHQRNKLQ